MSVGSGRGVYIYIPSKEYVYKINDVLSLKTVSHDTLINLSTKQ